MQLTLVALIILAVLLEGLLFGREVGKANALEAQLDEQSFGLRKRAEKICGPRPAVHYLKLDRSHRQYR